MSEKDNGSDRDRLEYQGISVGEKLENFWYYNKWKVIIGAFFLVVAIIVIAQFAGRENPDVYIMYAGESYLNVTGVDGMRNAFRAVIDDYNGDGEHGIMLTTLTCHSDEQIAEREEAAREETREFYVDRSANMQNIKSFDAEIFAGESVICLLDPWLFDRVDAAGGFVPMSEIFTEEELASLELYGNSGIYLRSTKFAKYYTALGNLSEDTVLCIRRISSMSVFKGQKKYERLHDDHVDAFRRIALFEYPEGYVPDSEQ